MSDQIIEAEDPIHEWFGLSYNSYLVMPRSCLQSMPVEWQKRLIALIKEAQQTLYLDDMPDYRVNAVNSDGKFVSDPYRDYERGRRRVSNRR